MNRVALVTGGTHGIGAAIVQRLSRDGFDVVFTGRDEAAGREIEGRVARSQFHCTDVGSEDEIRSAVQAALDRGDGSVAALVNNVGVTRRAGFAETVIGDWDELLAVNARSAYLFTRLTLDALVAAGGAVVFMSSVAGGIVGEGGLAIYSASKAAMVGLARSLALEYGHAVRFNVVCPGQIATRMMARVTSNKELLRSVEARIPRGRIGTPDDVARVVAWLVSSEADFVNGAVVPVDGGETTGIFSAPTTEAPN